MEKEEGRNQRVTTFSRVLEPEFPLQWGNTKRLRCFKIKDEEVSEKSDGVSRKRIKSRIDRRVVRTDKETPSSISSPNRVINNNKNASAATPRSNGLSENRKSQSCSPEKEDRYYSTRGSVLGFDDNGKIFMEAAAAATPGTEDKGFVWPKLFISLSNKEKEEDFMAMKGCKLPQRPKKRAKFVQRSLLLVSPGTWLSDLCQERYEVREKKTAKKRPRGLKAMGSMDSDSE
ncbi:hypothetical protein C5167_045648 [Papaver somniferum]|uniref:Uncharacterized protein n=1 Tax=Papaver somniferum TaxID=3469 RepID=A0A4Y7LCB8_PAPSO|nr:uncharacterized protein LOC113320147 [Papaver somniferum]RZC82866.1 hypothetical protein C5167_045648 [Papaver somniferum]